MPCTYTTYSKCTFKLHSRNRMGSSLRWWVYREYSNKEDIRDNGKVLWRADWDWRHSKPSGSILTSLEMAILPYSLWAQYLEDGKLSLTEGCQEILTTALVIPKYMQTNLILSVLFLVNHLSFKRHKNLHSIIKSFHCPPRSCSLLINCKLSFLYVSGVGHIIVCLWDILPQTPGLLHLSYPSNVSLSKTSPGKCPLTILSRQIPIVL